MAEFTVRLGTPAGEIVTRTVEALAANEVRARLEQEGFKVFAVTAPKTEGTSLLSRSGSAGARSRVKANDFLLFNQQLSALLRAGIPILQAITMLRRRATTPKLRAVLEEVEEAIRGGAALSQAFAAQGATFPRIYTASILAGERSGALDEVLSRYVNYMRRSVGLRRKIRGALAYPAFLLIACLGMVIFLTTYVVPRMSDLFTGFGNNLPTVTVFVLAISGWLTRNALWLVPTLAVSSVAIFLWSRTPGGRLIIDRAILKLPLAGKSLESIEKARLTSSIRTTAPQNALMPSQGRAGGAVRRSSSVWPLQKCEYDR
jgi:type IV pilus assembly protein PilC